MRVRTEKQLDFLRKIAKKLKTRFRQGKGE
jgi:hypothetical protein